MGSHPWRFKGLRFKDLKLLAKLHMTHTLKCFPSGKILILWDLNFFFGLCFMCLKAIKTSFCFFMCNFVLTNLKFYPCYSKWLIITKVTLSNQGKWEIIVSQFSLVPRSNKELGMSVGKVQTKKYSFTKSKEHRKKSWYLPCEGPVACTLHCSVTLPTRLQTCSQILRKCSWIRLY